MKPANKIQQQWNGAFDEETVLRGRNKPEPPSQSWWLGLNREEFRQALEREWPRMSMSTIAGKVSSMVIGAVDR